MANRRIKVCVMALVLVLSGCGTGENQIKQTVTEALDQGGEDQTNETTASPPSEETKVPSRIGKLGDDYILPDAQEHTYTEQELKGLTLKELAFARNEIYARRGRKFNRDDVREYFSGKSWYHGTVAPENFDEGVLNQMEKDNIKLLQRMESGNEVCSVPKIGIKEFPVIDGSTATLPISQALYRMATGAKVREAEAAVEHTKTTNAWMSLIRKDGYGNQVELVIAYEPGESVKEAMKKSGGELIIKPIGRDALVFLANQSNTVKSLTDRQILDIYSGTLVNWKDLGGKDSAIRAFQRQEDSGSQNLMEKLVMKGRGMAAAPLDYVVGEMGELVERVSAYDNTGDALGYSVYYYAKNMYQKPELRFMAVDNVMPSGETIRDGSYPYVSDFYAAIRADEPKDSNAYMLFEWLSSEDGQSLVNGLGYVGVSESAKKLPAEILEPEEVFDAELNLPDGYVLLASGNYLYGEYGIGVFDSKMRLLQFISHVESDGFLFQVCRQDGVVKVMDTRSEQLKNYLIQENRVVDAGEEVDEEGDSDYELAWSFADDHPELLNKYGVTKEAVDDRGYGESALPVMIIKDGNTEHYYDVYGAFLLDFDTEGKGEEKLPYRRVHSISSDMAYIRTEDRDTGEVRYRIYRNGELVKELISGENDSVYDITPSFYTRSVGNYLYFYNYQDEPCAKFLEGYYRMD